MELLAGKRALVMGVANARSIAWGIARAFHHQGANLVLSYQNERLGREVAKLASEVGCDFLVECDVASDDQIAALIARIEQEWGGLDVIVHAIAHAPREALHGDYLEGLSREAYLRAHEVSAYSFSAVARAARPLLAQSRGPDPPSGALLTLSYVGAVRTVDHYNVMGPAKASLEASVRYLAAALGREGIRVNGISAGAIRTLAAGGIGGLRRLLAHDAAHAPLQRGVTIDEVGAAAAFLCSDLASGITGEMLYVDGGANVVGLASAPPDRDPTAG